jgi:spermidine synthase
MASDATIVPRRFYVPSSIWVPIVVCVSLIVSYAASTSPGYHLGWDTTTNSVPASVSEWVEETGFYQSIRLTEEEPLYRKQSAYQLIEVRQSPYYGKLLVLDGVVQITERDGNSYNEMLSHIPMFQNAHPQRVLVIGGGDGYVVSEVLKHSSVEHVDHVDLDTDVIETCKQFFSWSDCWNDPRVHLHIADGAKFVRNALDQSYDVIIQDSSDPWKLGKNGEQVNLPSSVLYAPEHFQNIFRILKPNGVLNMQAESLQIPSDLEGIRSWRNLALSVGFESAKYGSIMISSYPTGQIGFLLCERDQSAASSLDLIENRFAQLVEANKSTTYYHPPLQAGSFILPLWAMKHIYNDKVNIVPNGKVDEL